MDDTLKTLLTHRGIDTRSLRTMRAVMREYDGPRVPSFPLPSEARVPVSRFEVQYPVYTLEAPKTAIIPLWEGCRQVLQGSAYSAVLIGNICSLSRLWENLSTAPLPPHALAQALTIDAVQWLKEVVEDFLEGDDEISPYADAPSDPWADTQPWMTFTTAHLPEYAYSAGTLQLPHYVAILRTQENWQIPAYLGFGSFNGCPSPHIHAALHRYWADQHQSQIICVTADCIICELGNPIQTQEAAMKLAHEWIGYSQDNLVDTIDYQAASMLGSRYMFSWWD
jgi:hypothetical protein